MLQLGVEVHGVVEAIESGGCCSVLQCAVV